MITNPPVPLPGSSTAGAGPGVQSIQSELVPLAALGNLPGKYDLQVSTERDQHKKYSKFSALSK